MTTKRLLACGLIAPWLFVSTFTVDGATRPGYHPMHHWVSHLSLGPRGWLGVLNLATTGGLMLGFAAGVRRALRPERIGVVASRLMATTGVGLIMAGMFQQDPGLGYPPGSPSSAGSWHDGLHKIGALLIYGALVAAAWVLRRRFGEVWRVYSLVSATGVLAAFVITSVLVALDYADVLPGAPSGLFERIALVVGFAWVFALAMRSSREPLESS